MNVPTTTSSPSPRQSFTRILTMTSLPRSLIAKCRYGSLIPRSENAMYVLRTDGPCRWRTRERRFVLGTSSSIVRDDPTVPFQARTTSSTLDEVGSSGRRETKESAVRSSEATHCAARMVGWDAVEEKRETRAGCEGRRWSARGGSFELIRTRVVPRVLSYVLEAWQKTAQRRGSLRPDEPTMNDNRTCLRALGRLGPLPRRPLLLPRLPLPHQDTLIATIPPSTAFERRQQLPRRARQTHISCPHLPEASSSELDTAAPACFCSARRACLTSRGCPTPSPR